jgi:hypothetical protein
MKGQARPALVVQLKVIKITSYPGVSQAISDCQDTTASPIRPKSTVTQLLSVQTAEKCGLWLAEVGMDLRTQESSIPLRNRAFRPRLGTDASKARPAGRLTEHRRPHACDRERIAAEAAPCVRKVNRHNAIRGTVNNPLHK